MKKIFGREVFGNEEFITILDLSLRPLCDDLIKIGDAHNFK
jgi:hypothetical protein